MRILIELPTWLGDAVMTTPAIENLLSNYNIPQVTIIGSSVSVEIMKDHPSVVKTFILSKKYRHLFKLSQNLSEFDIFFSFRGSFRTKILGLLISSKKKYQYKKNIFQDQHQVEKYNRFINDCLNSEHSAGKLKIYTKFESKVHTKSLVVGINPGASYGNAKRWYPEEFSKVAAELSRDFKIIIFGGPNELSIAKDIEDDLINKGVTNVINIAGRTSISDLIEQISNLDLFVTNDSGPMHLAASFQVPTISIFGPTRDSETSQWMNNKSVIVKKRLDCQPCMKRTCPLHHHNCMKLIKADDVLNAIETIS